MIGGLAAAVVIIVFDGIGMFVLGMDMEAWLAEHRLVQPPMALWIIACLVFGLLLVFLYAAMRPRFGPGAKTALIGAAVLWVLFGAIYAMQTGMGLYTQREYFTFAGWGALQLAAAATAGAWLYKEVDGTAAPRI